MSVRQVVVVLTDPQMFRYLQSYLVKREAWERNSRRGRSLTRRDNWLFGTPVVWLLSGGHLGGLGARAADDAHVIDS